MSTEQSKAAATLAEANAKLALRAKIANTPKAKAVAVVKAVTKRK